MHERPKVRRACAQRVGKVQETDALRAASVPAVRKWPGTLFVQALPHLPAAVSVPHLSSGLPDCNAV